jgi:hypothetical protein
MQVIVTLAVFILVLGVITWVLWPKVRRTIHQKLAMVINEVMQQREHDVSLALARRATNDSAAWLGSIVMGGSAYPDKWSLLEASLKAASTLGGGLYCEFGVYNGASINFIAERTHSVVHGFDSFEGLPEDWRPGREKGTFKVDALPRVRENVQLHKGWFEATLPAFRQAQSGPLAFLHIDADLCSSTEAIFDVLGDRIVPGTVLQFDEYFNYPSWRDGEHRAFDNFQVRRNAKVEFIGYVPGDEQIAVKVVKIDPV